MNKLEKFEILLNAHILALFDDVIPTNIQFDDAALAVRKMNASHIQLSDIEFDAVKKKVQEYRPTYLQGITLVDKGDTHELWFTKRKQEGVTKSEYNDRFKKYLQIQKKWTKEAVEKQDRDTDKIMDYLGDPNNESDWARKGLIIGDVQAGKTVNYTSICNKAVDSGYNVIIILAGVTNTLRKQTQLRLEKDFVGYTKNISNTAEKIKSPQTGVSKFGKVSLNVQTFTSESRDFSKVVKDSITSPIDKNSAPKLFVVKKIKSVLDNLLSWFESAAKINGALTLDVPMLLIDDESDNASVNTTGDDANPTTINNGIRKILKIFNRSTYLGITATPFANIFINPYVGQDDQIDPDLFPKDFIHCLMAPPEYIGGEKIFGKFSGYGDKVTVEINDVEPQKTDIKIKKTEATTFSYGHKKSLIINEIPHSLKKSISYFVLTNAIRDYRGHSGTHRSMLVNVSRFVDVQNQLRDKVSAFFNGVILSDLENYSKLKYEEAMRYSTIKVLKEIWDECNLSEIAECEWSYILKNHLFESNCAVKVMAINQKSIDKLDYDKHQNGLRVIAVGGNCLSRGLTLEDLVVSYFHRNSQMYDTLMQMGRWFGYRPDYSDLVKLWISKDAKAWYTHISESTEELKLEIIRMNRNELTPLDFGLMIKGHPDILIPTARNKMRHVSLEQSYVKVDIEGKLIESPRLHYNIEELEKNKKLIDSFVENLDSIAKEYQNEFLWCGVSSEKIADLVETFKSEKWSWYFYSKDLADYIRESYAGDWDVSIQTGEGGTVSINSGTKEHTVRLQTRYIEIRDDILYISGTKVRVGKGEYTKSGLSVDVAKKIAEDFKKAFPDNNITDSVYLHTKRNPILFIHILECNEKSSDEIKKLSFNIVALGLGFSVEKTYDPNRKPKKLKMYLNKVATAEELNSEDGDDEIVD